MKKLFIAFFSLVLASVALAAGSPTDTINDGSNKLLNIIKQDTGRNTAQVRQQMENAAVPMFDFQRMTALAVGQGWRNATPAQQAALTQEFKSLLVRTYAGTMMRFKNAKVDVRSNPVMANSGREATVKSVVNPGNGKQSVAVDYTMYKGSQGWKIYNVIVEGASLVTVYRNQFNEEIKKNGVDGLIKLLKDKNANPASATGGR